MNHQLTPGCGNDACRGCGMCNTRFCTACGLMDASLTTDCCGQEVSAAGQAKICDGKLDYRVDESTGHGQWVAAMNPAQREMERMREINRNAVKGGHAGAYR